MRHAAARSTPERERSRGVFWCNRGGVRGFVITFATGWLHVRVTGQEQHDSGFCPKGAGVWFHPEMLGPHEYSHDDQRFMDAVMIGGAHDLRR